MRCLTAASGEADTAGTRQTDFFVSLKRQDVSVLVAARTQHGYPPPVTHPGQPPHPTPLRQVITGVNGHAVPRQQGALPRVTLSSVMVRVV